MSYCPKCGSKVSEDMLFCPNCGAPLKGEKPPAEAAPAPYRDEKAEKYEKREKREKHEKREKSVFGAIGWLIGGLILIFLGLIFYLEIIDFFPREVMWASFLIIVGVMIIAGALLATRRYPKT